MATMRTGSFARTLAITFVGGLIGPLSLAATLTAQNPEFKPRPAAAQPPPEVAEAERERPPQAPSRQPTLQELLDQVARQTGGKDKVDRARTGKRVKLRPAVRTAPPEAMAIEGARPPRDPGRRSSLNELLDQVRKQPGGAAKVDAALRHGRPNPQRTGTMAWSLGLTADPVPLSVTSQAFSLGLNASNNFRVSSSNYATFNGTRGSLPTHLWSYSKNSNWGTFGHKVEKPVAFLKVTVPRDDYYLVNVRATDAMAQLRIYDPVTRTYPIDTSWDRRGDQGWFFDYPAVVELSAGTHYIYWVLLTGDAYVLSISVKEI
jgi:hypothetical protein